MVTASTMSSPRVRVAQTLHRSGLEMSRSCFPIEADTFAYLFRSSPFLMHLVKKPGDPSTARLWPRPCSAATQDPGVSVSEENG